MAHTRMSQKHAQCNLPLFRHQLVTVNDLDLCEFLRHGLSLVLPLGARECPVAIHLTRVIKLMTDSSSLLFYKAATYRRKLLDQVSIIQRKFSLLNQLHAGDSSDHLRA